MDDHDIILVMAICELLGKSVAPKDVEKAIEKAREKLERSGQPPRAAVTSHAHRRD